MSFKQEINKQEKEILDHLMESKFISSFAEVDSETGEYIRDIKEADNLEIDFVIRGSMLSTIGECAKRAADSDSAVEMRAALIAVYTACEGAPELESLGRNIEKVIATLGGKK